MIGTDAEHAVLGACMGSKDAYRFAAEIITPDDFSHPDLGEVFDIIVGLGKRRVDVSLVAVATEVTRRQLKAVTQADVAGWFNVPGNSGTVAHYAGLVLEDATRRRASAAVAAAQQALMEGAERPSDVVGELTGRLNALSQGHGKALLEAKTLSEVLSVRDEFDWLIPSLLERRDRVVVTAGEGAGKTTFIRQMAIASASGVNPITFQQIDPVKVLVIDAENSESQWRRQAMGMVRRGQHSGSADPGENVILACSPRMNIVADKWLGAIHRLVEDHKPSMVCIGPLYRLAAGNLGKEEDMGQVLAALDTLRDKGLAMIIEAHAGHSKDANHNRELRPRGSSALMGWPEFGFGLARDPNMEGRVVLQRWRGDREERSWPDALDRGGAWPWVDAMALPHVRQAAYGNAA